MIINSGAICTKHIINVHRPNYIPFVADDFKKAVKSAAKGRKKRPEVKEALKDVDGFCASIKQHLKDGSWRKDIEYRKLTKVNNNKKVRHIDAPTFRTLVYEHLLKNKLEPIYRRRDPLVSLNCKEGCGITPSAKHKELKSNYVLPRVKHLFYDMREMNWIVTADQRKCYMHVKPSVFRKELKYLIGDKWLIDFAVELCFVDGQLPVGTPTSPLAHHILMLRFHEWLCRNTEWRLCYADNCMVACRTREEAQQMKWRIRQYWWYELDMRAKRGDTRVTSINDKRGIDFCGYRVIRNAGKHVSDTNKGYCLISKDTLLRARKCDSNESWGSYFGLMRHTDGFGEMVKIEKEMKLRELTKKIRIDRKMDAPNIKPLELARSGQAFTVFDYEIRKSEKSGEPNWIKMLIGMPEVTADGELTGKTIAREVHGGMMGIVAWMVEAEKEYGKKNLLPLEDVRIVDECGYIFEGSTNQMEYIEC